ncbi:TPA: GNAT family N-acetyltransferase [Vibrio cholerae]|uniref:GNAT family N-acetyltransferase n=1 Tax=Vibrio TaxID=662 RepID=UPI000BA922B4|nr:MULTISPECIES: GNAT family N-acetyltransferase [Vibrio]PAR30513.1 GNAT family N-acetyltransferase [Vibrio metoecus]RBM33703.1 N-acetyltransferase [Vibrio tarriae]TXY86719.1 GNAT family N-acetyltransferase [Vibrio cholerae]BCN20854.1 putative monosaccharide biosynthesis protein [Vibrio cholerae]BCN22079.1 putative monosaccharide biosynthesis protein [Vibrio cholerae]
MNVDHLTLVLADKSDFTFYHAMKSESQSIYWSGFSSAPDRTRLLEHYTAMLNYEDRDIYIFKEHDVRIGYLCVDKDRLNNTAEISYGVSAQHAGRGLAKIMIQLGLEHIEPIFVTQVAWIAESNIASVKTATALGFRAADECEYRQLAQSPTPVKFIKYSR